MISSEHRFHGRTSLSFVYRRGYVVRDRSMVLRFALNPRRQSYRLAVIVSRKIHKSAVKRNRVRRRIYAIVQGYEDRITEPFDLILTVYSDQVIDLAPPELERSIVHLLTKAKILSARPHHSSAPPRAIVDTSKERS